MISENTKPQMRFFHALNPLTPIDDQYRISPYNINTILGRNVTRIWWKYKVGDYSLIQNQILRINITRVTWQTVRRITNEILGMRGLPPPPLNTCGCQVCLQCSSQESIKSQLLVVYRRLEGLLLPSIKPAQALMFGFHLNPLTPKIPLVILITVCHTILTMSFWRIWYRIITSMLDIVSMLKGEILS